MSSMGGERMIATMVFADLVGSTELAASSRQAWIEAGSCSRRLRILLDTKV
jgi:class 3 adenylate cyclase